MGTVRCGTNILPTAPAPHAVDAWGPCAKQSLCFSSARPRWCAYSEGCNTQLHTQIGGCFATCVNTLNSGCQVSGQRSELLPRSHPVRVLIRNHSASSARSLYAPRMFAAGDGSSCRGRRNCNELLCLQSRPNPPSGASAVSTPAACAAWTVSRRHHGGRIELPTRIRAHSASHESSLLTGAPPPSRQRAPAPPRPPP